MKNENKVTKLNEAIFKIEAAIREHKETTAARMMLFKLLAEDKKRQYDIYIKAGFTAEQSLELINK